MNEKRDPQQRVKTLLGDYLSNDYFLFKTFSQYFCKMEYNLVLTLAKDLGVGDTIYIEPCAYHIKNIEIEAWGDDIESGTDIMVTCWDRRGRRNKDFCLRSVDSVLKMC